MKTLEHENIKTTEQPARIATQSVAGGSNNLPAGRQGVTIILFYLPQLLEYLGFGLLFLFFPLLILRKKSDSGV